MFRRIFVDPFIFFSLACLLTVAMPIAEASDINHGHDCVTATQVKPGPEQQVSFAGAGDRAVYRIVLDKRGLLDVRANSGSADVAKVELLDSSCSPIRSVTAGTSLVTGKSSLLTIPSDLWTLGPGVYFVRFDPAGKKVSSSPFKFETIFTPHYGHDCATAEPMGLFASMAGELLYPEDREVFAVTLEEAGQIHAWITGESNPNVDLYLADCSLAGEMQFDDETGTGIVTSILAPGTYYLSVRPESFKRGRFTLNVEFSQPANIDHPYSGVELD